MPRTLEELEVELRRTYTKETYKLAPMKNLGGFDYIAWNESTALANSLFGPLGWSSSVLSIEKGTVETIDEDTGVVTKHTGYHSIVRVTVHTLLENGTIHDSWHDGVGFGTITPMGRKNPMDTACKAAKSDGVSTAVKHFGDYFGLFLYDKEETASYQPTPGRPAAASGGKPALSPARENVLRNKKFPESAINVIKTTWDWKKVAGLCKDVMENGMTTKTALETYNLMPVAAGKSLYGGTGLEGMDDLDDDEHPF